MDGREEEEGGRRMTQEEARRIEEVSYWDSC